MGIQIQPQKISLDYFKNLFLEKLEIYIN